MPEIGSTTTPSVKLWSHVLRWSKFMIPESVCVRACVRKGEGIGVCARAVVCAQLCVWLEQRSAVQTVRALKRDMRRNNQASDPVKSANDKPVHREYWLLHATRGRVYVSDFPGAYLAQTPLEGRLQCP